MAALRERRNPGVESRVRGGRVPRRHPGARCTRRQRLERRGRPLLDGALDRDQRYGLRHRPDERRSPHRRDPQRRHPHLGRDGSSAGAASRVATCAAGHGSRCCQDDSLARRRRAATPGCAVTASRWAESGRWRPRSSRREARSPPAASRRARTSARRSRRWSCTRSATRWACATTSAGRPARPPPSSPTRGGPGPTASAFR